MNTKKRDYTLHDCWEIINHYHASIVFHKEPSNAEKERVSKAIGYLGTYANHAHYGAYGALRLMDEQMKRKECEER